MVKKRVLLVLLAVAGLALWLIRLLRLRRKEEMAEEELEEED